LARGPASTTCGQKKLPRGHQTYRAAHAHEQPIPLSSPSLAAPTGRDPAT